jgi:very-short-patch-repair endonuclease
MGVAQAAAAQRGLVTCAQLRTAGLSRDAVSWRRARGRLHLVLPGVYAAGHDALQPLAPELAALLSFERDVVVSHQSAAWIWGLVQTPPACVHVTVIGRNARSRDGVAVHRVSHLDPRDVRLRDGIPATAPARTLIDFAGGAALSQFERALSEARVLELVSDRQLTAAMARSPRRAGVALMRAALQEGGPRMTRSEGERRLLRLIRQAHLPGPETNVSMLGYELDFLWRAQRLVVEVDGYRFHGHRAAFERDRAKDQALVAAGYRVIRVTLRQLEYEPLAVLARIIQALSAGPLNVPALQP